MNQYKPSYSNKNYVTDTVGHISGNFGYEEFNKKYREWEIRRGLRDPEDSQTVLRGGALRSSRVKSKKTPK
jgi:hypothetical protein